MILAKAIRPIPLILSGLTYLLGAGMARYFTGAFQTRSFWLGLIWVGLIQSATFLLLDYFCSPTSYVDSDETTIQREKRKTITIQITAALMAIAAAITVMMLILEAGNTSAYILMVFIFGLFASYAVPPLQTVYSGYGELTLAIVWANLIPALGFMLQHDEIHRYLPMATFPLTLLALAYLLVGGFAGYASDQKFRRSSLVIRLTWQRAIVLHHFLVVIAFLLYGLAPLVGMSWTLVWPVFLSIPFAVAQIYLMQKISKGGRVTWKLMLFLASSVFGLTSYLLTFTFWIR